MFGRTVFEVSEFKRGLMVKKQDFEAEKIKISNLAFMPYGHFPARNGSKLHNCYSKSEKVNKAPVSLVDFF